MIEAISKEEALDIVLYIAKGNPGCAQFLSEMLQKDPLGFRYHSMILAKNNLRGSDAYMIWNDACGRDTEKAMRLLERIYSGELPIKTVRAHLDEGWCAPFHETDFTGTAVFQPPREPYFY